MNKINLRKRLMFIIEKEIQMSSITITLGDQAENHKGMQIIGTPAQHGFSRKQIEQARHLFEKQGFKCVVANLNEYIEIEAEDACVLVIKRGVDALLQNMEKDKHQLFQELIHLDWDAKAFMYGKVVNKHARHNLCFSEESQNPDYQSGKGRVVSWKDVPLLSELRKSLGKYFKDADKLAAEGNYYYDVKKCGIGFHGDSERKKVIAFRVANGMCEPLHYQWFVKGKPIGKRAIIELEDRDIYVMSQKAVGTDWKKKNIATLRHATGCDKFTKI